MLRQATIHALKNTKPIKLTVLHHAEDDCDPVTVGLQVGGGVPIRVQADELREAIADVLPKGEA